MKQRSLVNTGDISPEIKEERKSEEIDNFLRNKEVENTSKLY